MVKFYSSNLTHAQFDLIRPLLPPAKPGGRPRSTSLWAVLNAIFYVVTQGCKWRDIPSDFPAWQTVYTYFRNWRKDGTWQALHARLRAWTRTAVGRPESPSEVILDSQTVPTVAMVQQAVGFDRFKATKGRKRHTVVDTLGLVMCARYGREPARTRRGETGAATTVCTRCESRSPLPHLGGWRLQWSTLCPMGDGRLSLSDLPRAAPRTDQGLCAPEKALDCGTDVWLVTVVSTAQL